VVSAANLSSLTGGLPISLATLQQTAAAGAPPGTILAAQQPQQTSITTAGTPLQGHLLPGGAQIISELQDSLVVAHPSSGSFKQTITVAVGNSNSVPVDIFVVKLPLGAERE
jgi:hypothetical protein